jgi:hypothetical protein
MKFAMIQALFVLYVSYFCITSGYLFKAPIWMENLCTKQ